MLDTWIWSYCMNHKFKEKRTSGNLFHKKFMPTKIYCRAAHMVGSVNAKLPDPGYSSRALDAQRYFLLKTL